MNEIWHCRRSMLSLIAMLLLTFLGYTKGFDVGWAIAGCSGSVAAANAYEKKALPPKPKKDDLS